MVENAASNINHKNVNENRINLYFFDNNLIKIIIFTDKIILNIFPYFKNGLFELQYKPIIKELKKISNDNKKQRQIKLKK